MGKKKTQEEFIKEAREVHGDRYDYSQVEYVNNRTKVKIVCPIHGVFEQIPDSHMRGRGCNKCVRPVHDNKSFISKAKEIHGEKYNYSNVEYVNSRTKISIICEEHGEFEQTPNAHTHKNKPQGCPKCGNIQKSKTNTKSQEEVINQFKEVHGDYYNYSKFVYKNANTKGIIICPKHGKFTQRVADHKKGVGCSKCQSSKGETNIREYLSDNNIIFEEQKTFEGCKDKTLLRFDFYIPSQNLIIEYDGIQHYEPIYFGKKSDKTKQQLEKLKNDNLKVIQRRDQIKNDYCADNKINLLRIKYTDKPFIQDILKFTFICY